MVLKNFTESETKIIVSILVVLFVVIGFNMSTSLRRGRDSIRKNDISAVQGALDTYYQKYHIYPLSNDKGQIIGCFNEKPQVDLQSGVPINVVLCDYVQSRFEDLRSMPRDPNHKKGAEYLYISDGSKYEFFISLEGKDEAEYSPTIVTKNLQCGNRICNYGKGNKW